MVEEFLINNLFAVLFYSWLIVGTIFLFVELALPGFLGFVSCSLGCFAAAAAAYVEISVYWQCWLALGVAAASFALLWMVVSSKKPSALYRTNVHSLIGQEATVLEPISLGVSGRIKIRGEEWGAVTHGSRKLEPTETVRIKAIDGNMLIVE